MNLFPRRNRYIAISVPMPLQYPVLAFILATLITATCLLASQAWAAPAGQRQTLVNQEEGQQPPLSKARITVEKKSLKRIYAYGKTFAVNKETLIVGTDGKEVALKKMLVPCDVEVSYQMEKGVRTAKRIDIKRVADGAGWQWVSEHPE